MNQRRPTTLLVVLAALIFVGLLLHIAYSHPSYPGSENLTPGGILREILKGQGGSGDNAIVWMFRLPRALACVLVGAILGVVGSAFQALFRNPIADPYIVGASSGASIGGVLAMLLGIDGIFGVVARPVFGFVTGIAALALVFALAKRRNATDVTDLLIAGTVTGSLLASIQSLLILMRGFDANVVLRWLLGSVSDVFWAQLAIIAPLGIVGAYLLIRQARRLNALAIGEVTAAQLGVPVRKLRNTILVISTAMIAVTVGSFGIIGFLGLVAPHISRRLLGVDWRWSMIGSLAVGALLFLIADGLSQRIGDFPGGLPVGVVTAVIGAPVLLVMMRREIQ